MSARSIDTVIAPAMANKHVVRTPASRERMKMYHYGLRMSAISQEAYSQISNDAGDIVADHEIIHMRILQEEEEISLIEAEAVLLRGISIWRSFERLEEIKISR